MTGNSNTSRESEPEFFWLILLFMTLGNLGMAQSSLNDCSGAIEVCGNGAISSNATGVGRQEINSNACASMEHNSLWIKIEITKAGTLGFNLTPTSSNLQIDYDFFVFGPNAACGNLGMAIRCSTTNPLAAGQTNNLTGMNDRETETSEGPGPNGNSFVKSLDVLPGESYYIVIDRPIGQSPFDLEWTGTSTLNGSPFPEGVEVNKPKDLIKCGINGIAEFDLFDTREEITSQAQTEIKFFSQLAQAIDNVNELPATYQSSVPSKTIYARVENLITGCSEIVDFSLITTPGPAIREQVTAEVCDLDLDGIASFDLASLQQEILQDLSPQDHTFSFYSTFEDAVNTTSEDNSVQNISGGRMFARVEEVNGSTCFSIATIDLQVKEPATIPDISAASLNLRVASKKITLTVKPELDYALNDSNGPYFRGPSILNVPAGMNTLYIRNADRCEISSIEVLVPEYAAAFSPNNDGINDHWFVSTGNYPAPNQPVLVFDRYGKLVSRFFINSGNWDGTFNGRRLPADDYWFEFSLPKNGILRGHFSLLK